MCSIKTLFNSITVGKRNKFNTLKLVLHYIDNYNILKIYKI